MSEALTWAALISSLGAITAFVAFWVKIGGHLEKADSASAISAAALAKVDLLSSQLSEYKVEVARGFASAADLKDVESRLVQSIDGLAKQFGRMAERLDRFLDREIERRQ